MNKRDTFYFPHEYNAKDDPKCERLIWEMGMEGYGMFWALLEVLRAQPDYTYPVANIPIIARKYNADPEKLRHVVFDFGLFSIVDDRIFFSNGLTARMQVIDDRRKRLLQLGKSALAQNVVHEPVQRLCGTLEQDGEQRLLVIDPRQQLRDVRRRIPLCVQRSRDGARRRAREHVKPDPVLFKRLQRA